jgi:hypothetical protein
MGRLALNNRREHCKQTKPRTTNDLRDRRASDDLRDRPAGGAGEADLKFQCGLLLTSAEHLRNLSDQYTKAGDWVEADSSAALADALIKDFVSRGCEDIGIE